jgi:hypothetical protein
MTEEINATEVKEEVVVHQKPQIISKRKGGRPRRLSVLSVKAPEAARPERSKPKRVKFNDRNRISFTGLDPDFVYRVVNDKAGRIERMQEIGYEFVESDEQLGDYRVAEGSKMGRAVSKPVGGGVNGYLMRIKKEFYEEDRIEKDKRIDAVESALKPSKAKGEYGTGLTKE